MPSHEFLSREELVAQTIDEVFRAEYNIVDSPISALELRSGMVLAIRSKLRVVSSVRYENGAFGPVVTVETGAGSQRFPSNAQVNVWHMNRRPFILTLPPESGGVLCKVGQGGSTPPAHDTAGVVPVWREPKRFN